MPRLSAGILLYHFRHQILEVFLVHPGGPFWAKKDAGAWSLPKGEFTAGEDPLLAARREFKEETGYDLDGFFLPLSPIRQKSGKIIQIWALEGEADPAAIKSNTFPLEWPPKSGHQQEFPEIDRAGWFTLQQAREKIVSGQLGFLQELETLLKEKR
ncbi:MAG: NUDIX hydrolase [Caldithrix sp. RBG_13_44_9]|nr:MAG: NUDIX hydrolase [Caldithrix sp. RBG_13_44_9]